MISLRASRKLLLRLLVLHMILLCIGIAQRYLPSTIDSLLDAAANRYLYHVVPDKTTSSEEAEPQTLDQQFLSLYHAHSPKPNPHIARLSTKCHLKPEPDTRHLRFKQHSIMEIVMGPPIEGEMHVSQPRKRDQDENNPPEKQYFNPTFIPLPPDFNLPEGLLGAKVTPTYLLVSRLVTEGLHQESHYCFASISSAVSSESLVRRQYMQCRTAPRPLNIPPTPANQCTGAWSSFPDIPGFHDPRVFWSGRGEPLIIVNSGSAYGCVGLWIVDLRAVIPELDHALDGEDMQKGGVRWRKLPLRYEYLTEITKNPRASRNEVEKNWVMFFPSRDESVVVYEAMGHYVVENEGKESIMDEDLNSDLPTNDTDDVISFNFTHATFEVEVDVLNKQVSAGTSYSTFSQHMNLINSSVLIDLESETDPKAIIISASITNKFRQEFNSSASPQVKSTHLSNLTLRHQHQLVQVRESMDRITNVKFHQGRKQPRIRMLGGRTQALLTSHGYTSPNLTHPSEPSCFNLSSLSHTHDHLNNEGHWHQGTNSLRLVLCSRMQVRDGTCFLGEHSSMPYTKKQQEEDDGWNSGDTYFNMSQEDELTQAGLIVHFSLIHRKFSNDWNLPMRYERYVLVWEARKPWRVVGVSKWPFVFNKEEVRIRSSEGLTQPMKKQGQTDENEHDEATVSEMYSQQQRNEDNPEAGDVHVGVFEADEDGLLLKTAYFTYSPSIAWAWRPIDDVHLNNDGTVDDMQNLGMGYLDDEVLIGIGIDDIRQGFVRIKARELLQCLKTCTGVDDPAKSNHIKQ